MTEDGKLQEVGDYIIIQHLGTGTTGKVKLARHAVTGQKVAIKMINKARFDVKPDLKRKIYREIALMRLLDHPHLLKLIEVCESKRRLYIIIEYAAHGELFDYLVARRSLSVEEGMKIFREIIYGLDYLHVHAICHRDLKPENLLLDEFDHIKIADFGFARWMRANIAETSCGSPHYAAPEVIRGLTYDGRAADVWSCGVILYALLSGRLPFDDPSIRNLMAKVKSGRYQMPPFIPEIQDLISKMLVVDTKKRITISQIKEHPAFRLFLPKNFIIPNPIPLPYLPDPVDVDSIDKKLFTAMVHLGFQDENEIRQELKSDKHNMAKVFAHILTTGFSLESLPWDKQQITKESKDSDDSNNEKESDEETNQFIVDSSETARAFTLHTNDPFYRKPHSMSLGSPDIFSLVEKAPWVTDQEEIEFEGDSEINDIEIPIPKLFEALQQQLTANQYKYFYPNEVTIFTKCPDSNMVVVVQATYQTKEVVTLHMRQIHGSVLLFSTFIQLINTVINSFN